MSKHTAQPSAQHAGGILILRSSAQQKPLTPLNSPLRPSRNAFLESFAAVLGCRWDLGDKEAFSCTSLSTLSVEQSCHVEFVGDWGRGLVNNWL